MNSSSKYRLVSAGTMGEPEVLKALLGPQIKVSEITLEGFEVRKQTRPAEHIWEILKQAWDDKGNPFLGAYTLVPQEGKKAVVGCVEFDSLHQLKLAAERLNFWNIHSTDPEFPAWFCYEKITDGKDQYYTESLNTDTTKLEPVEDDYREKPEYKSFVKIMAEQANDYRMSIEGPSRGKEQL